MTTPKRLAKIERTASRRQSGIIVLEDIYDPHNAAAVLRTMDGLGYQTAYFIFEEQERYNPKRVGKASSSSANKWIDIEIYDSTAACMTHLREAGYTTYATHLYPERQLSLYEDTLPTLGPRIALIFGNEHRGISPTMAKLADYHLHIPMAGYVESYNISVCAALVMAEVSRQRYEAGIEQYLLPPSERSALVEKWS